MRNLVRLLKIPRCWIFFERTVWIVTTVQSTQSIVYICIPLKENIYVKIPGKSPEKCKYFNLILFYLRILWKCVWLCSIYEVLPKCEKIFGIWNHKVTYLSYQKNYLYKNIDSSALTKHQSSWEENFLNPANRTIFVIKF